MPLTNTSRPRRTAAAAIAASLAAALTITGCGATGSTSGSAPVPGGSSSRGATFTETVDHDAFARMGYRLLWTGAAATSRRSAVARADVFDDAVVVQDTGGAVTLLQTSDGRTRWSVALGERLTRFVGNARAGDRVYVASDIELYVLAAETGDLVDRQSLDRIVSTRPVIAQNSRGAVAIFGTRNGRVLAHDLRTGLGRWQYQLEGAIEADPVRVGDNVGLVSETGDVIIVNPAEGTAVSRAKVFNGPGADPAATDAIMAFTCRDQSAYAFSDRRGERLWRFRTEQPLRSPMTIIEGVAYFAVPGQGILGLDAASGREIWKAEGASGEVVGKSSGAILVRDGQTIAAYDERGAEIVSAQIPGLHDAIMTNPSGGDLYLVTRRGAVSRFVPENAG